MITTDTRKLEPGRILNEASRDAAVKTLTDLGFQYFGGREWALPKSKYFVGNKAVTAEEYIVWCQNEIDRVKYAHLPPLMFYGTAEAEGEHHLERCAHVDGWNKCREAMQEVIEQPRNLHRIAFAQGFHYAVSIADSPKLYEHIGDPEYRTTQERMEKVLAGTAPDQRYLDNKQSADYLNSIYDTQADLHNPNPIRSETISHIESALDEYCVYVKWQCRVPNKPRLLIIISQKQDGDYRPDRIGGRGAYYVHEELCVGEDTVEHVPNSTSGKYSNYEDAHLEATERFHRLNKK